MKRRGVTREDNGACEVRWMRSLFEGGNEEVHSDGGSGAELIDGGQKVTYFQSCAADRTNV